LGNKGGDSGMSERFVLSVDCLTDPEWAYVEDSEGEVYRMRDDGRAGPVEVEVRTAVGASWAEITGDRANMVREAVSGEDGTFAWRGDSCRG
jgi:hypothetical protein